MPPVLAALIPALLSGDAGALAIVLILVGIVLGIVWALKIRDPSVNRMKYD